MKSPMNIAINGKKFPVKGDGNFSHEINHYWENEFCIGCGKKSENFTNFSIKKENSKEKHFGICQKCKDIFLSINRAVGFMSEINLEENE